MQIRTIVLVVLSLLVADRGYAEKPNHKDITAKDLRIGWEVEVETRAHVTHRHGYRGFKDQQKKQMWFGLGSMAAGIALGSQADNPLVGLATSIGTGLAMQAAVNGHGRKLEDEADVLGLHYMTEGGYDYMEAPEVWRVFNQYTKDQGKISNFFFSNHSTHAARINNLTKAINADYRGQVARTTLQTNEEEYQKVAERVQKENAVANLQSQEYARAQRGLAAQLDRNPNDANAHYNMGRVLWAQGGVQNAEQVLEAFANAIQLDPNFAAPWHDAGHRVLRGARREPRGEGLRMLHAAGSGRPGRGEDPAFLNAVRQQPPSPQ